MDNYRKSLIEWLTYLWIRDNPTKILDIKQYGSVSLAEGDTPELIDHIRQSMAEYSYVQIGESEIFDAITFINFLAGKELQDFHKYCQEKGIVCNTGELERGWFYKYDSIRRKEPINPTLTGLDKKFW
jgi:hypothetical protein